MVASIPVDSAIRRAARPVGATSEIEARCGLGRGADQADRGRLAGAGAAGDDREARGERGLDRLPLLGGGDELVVAGGEARCGARGGGGRGGAGGGPSGGAAGRARARRGRGGARSRPARPRARRSAGGRPRPPRRRPRARSARRRTCPAAARRRATTPVPSRSVARATQLRHRQARRARALGLAQHVHDRRARAPDRVARDARRARDRVRDLKADAEDARQLVGPALDDVVRAVAVLGRDPRHEPGQPVRREQQVQRARGAQPVPGPDRLVDPFRTQSDRPERPPRVGVDRPQHVVAVALQQPRRPRRRRCA